MKKPKLKSKTTNEKNLARAVNAGYVAFAATEEALITTSFTATAGIIAHQRRLSGDFNGLAQYLYAKHIGTIEQRGKATLTSADIKMVIPHLQGDIKLAAETVLKDMSLFSAAGVYPELRLLTGKGYKKSDGNIHSYHTDGGGGNKGRWLCRYTGAETDNLLPKDAQPKSNVPKYRAVLRNQYNKVAADFRARIKNFKWSFEAFLDSSHNQDSYVYVPRKHAKPFSFGEGDIVKQAVDGNEAGAHSNIHRARPAKKGDPLKLLLVGKP